MIWLVLFIIILLYFDPLVMIVPLIVITSVILAVRDLITEIIDKTIKMCYNKVKRGKKT